MKAVVYTVGGSAELVRALFDAGERIAIRSLRHFDEVEPFDVVGLEIEDSRIREAYEAAGARVDVLPTPEVVEVSVVEVVIPVVEIAAPVVESTPEPITTPEPAPTAEIPEVEKALIEKPVKLAKSRK